MSFSKKPQYLIPNTKNRETITMLSPPDDFELESQPKKTNSKKRFYNDVEYSCPSEGDTTSNVLESAKIKDDDYLRFENQIPPFVKTVFKYGKLVEIMEINNYQISIKDKQYMYALNFKVENDEVIKPFKKRFYHISNSNTKKKLSNNKQYDNAIDVLILTKNDDGILKREYLSTELDNEILINNIGNIIHPKKSIIPSDSLPIVYQCQNGMFHFTEMKQINRNIKLKLNKQKRYYICLDYTGEIQKSLHC